MTWAKLPLETFPPLELIATMNAALQLLPEQLHVERAYRRRTAMSDSGFIPKMVCRHGHGGETWKFAIFGGMHGDEEAGILASHELAEWAQAQPDELRDYELHVYPVCNPSGRMTGTRHCL